MYASFKARVPNRAAESRSPSTEALKPGGRAKLSEELQHDDRHRLPREKGGEHDGLFV